MPRQTKKENSSARKAPRATQSPTQVELPQQARSKVEASPRPASPAVEASAPPIPSEDEIRRRAYEIFLSRQGESGDPVTDWLQAERELRERIN